MWFMVIRATVRGRRVPRSPSAPLSSAILNRGDLSGTAAVLSLAGFTALSNLDSFQDGGVTEHGGLFAILAPLVTTCSTTKSAMESISAKPN